MENKELLQQYKDDVDTLRYNDEVHLDRIRRKGRMLIRNVYTNKSGYLSDFDRIRFYPSYAPADESALRRAWGSGKDKIINLINIMIEEESIFGSRVENQSEIKSKSTKKNNRVFIVHGHDDNSKVNVARFIEKLGLEAIILHEQASMGKTIIEKFEEHASSSCFAIALLTADDVGYPQNKEREAKPRARQNVIFELGYFCGALTRKNVSVLYKEGVEIPNDYLGVVYTHLDEGGAWQLQLAKEMKSAGIDFDMNRAFM